MSVITLYKGHTYIFDQSDSSNSGHPLRFSTTSDGTHGGGSEYTTGVTTSGTPGSAGAFTKLAVASDAPDTLYYYCTNHSGMGKNTNNKTSLQGGASGSSSPVTVSSLTNGESYNVRASAINAFGQSPYSNATSIDPNNLTGQVGIFAGGYTTDYINTIQYINFSAATNTTDFGDLSSAVEQPAGAASSTRAVFAGGYGGSGRINVIEYITILTKGNATDFGDLSAAANQMFGNSNATRAVIGIGYSNAYSNVLEYVTIASTGNATDFGDSTHSRGSSGAVASTTRIVFGGGFGSGYANIMDYVTISSAGNATDFGDLSSSKRGVGSASSNTRGVFAGGSKSGSPYHVNEIDYITIASAGNATDFGDLSIGIAGHIGGTSNKITGVFAGGRTDGSYTPTNAISQITIASTGNSTDWGDLAAASYGVAGTSNAHGGLS